LFSVLRILIRHEALGSLRRAWSRYGEGGGVVVVVVVVVVVMGWSKRHLCYECWEDVNGGGGGGGGGGGNKW